MSAPFDLSWRSWLMDCVANGVEGGSGWRCLDLNGDFTKKRLTIDVDTSLSGNCVAAVLQLRRRYEVYHDQLS